MDSLSDMYLEEERNRINAGFYIFLFDNTHHSRRGCGDMGMRLAVWMAIYFLVFSPRMGLEFSLSFLNKYFDI